MQTLRKRTSPCKYKNDPSRFLGEGITFKAKLIGILEVSEARGDKMCQDALNDLKTAIRAAGEHKQRITISISIDGLKLRDEKTGDCLYHHPVHKISFIAQDMSDSRAFGYIFGSPDTGHRFFGIKTDKTASQVVISMRDLFQVVFELKKKEIEMAKHQTEHHHSKYGSTGYLDSLNFSKNNNESEKGKAKYSQIMKSKCLTTKANESFAGTDLRGAAAEAIADLLDLEHELNNIQQGISQMEKITPSDPFGPLSKGDSYDPFDDSFSSKIDQSLEEKNSLITKPHIQTDNSKEIEKNFLSSVAAEKTNFFPQFSPTKNKSKVDDDKWFEHESEAFFDESAHISDVEFTASPASVLNNSGSALEQEEGRRSPLKIDLFMELDPLGTGRVKPYVDKKDFFQELKNPPKKVLKEMIVDGTSTELSVLYFPAQQNREQISSMVKSDGCTRSLDSVQSIKESSFRKNFANIDPFEDGDPFEKTDPFQEENFLTSEAFAPLFGSKTSTADNFDEKSSWRFDEAKEYTEERFDKDFSATPPLFSSGMLKVSLPPENLEIKSYVTSSKFCKQKLSPNSPEDSKIISKKIGHSNFEKSEDIPVLEKPRINSKGKLFESKFEADNFSSNIKFFTSPGTTDKIRSNNETLDPTTPDPPPRTKAALFSIKPPPLPPKKQIQSVTKLRKPPARPPLEDNLGHYDYLKQKEVLKNDNEVKEELKCVKLKQQLFNSKELFSKEPKKKTTESGFPVLPPPPPQKKISNDLSGKILITKDEREKENATIESEGSILNIKLRQLDKAGIENLATTLGIPPENIYCMTLQDLTTMLADKYLPSSKTKIENSLNESFEADFESNFANIYAKEENLAYDKYAVFKELIKSENELEQNDFQIMKKRNLGSLKENENMKEEAPQEEDKYAALRLLSLNSQSNQFSADDDDDDYNTAGKTDKICDSNSSIEKLPFHAKDLKSEQVVQNVENKMENTQEKIVKSRENEDLGRTKSPEFGTKPKNSFTSENLLFPNKDEHFNEKSTCSERNNWATFDKLNFEETITKKSSDLFEENENSPFSSDGKEELREIPFCWHTNDFSKKTRKDVPWRDEDESWEEDYSPKESFCSDESSHEEHSPKSRRDEIFTKQRSKRGACTKTSRNKNHHWSHRDKWQEETEDEFEESWMKHRGKTGSYDLEKKKTWRGNTREERSKHSDWNNSKDGSRGDDKRHSHYYGSRCKRSESDNEYRKRCDSDTSEKEYAWTFRKNCAESHGRNEKTKQYHSSDFSFRDCPEYCHKSRSKHRRGTFQKRPNSASESKRNSEKSFFSPGHSFREDNKTYPAKKESNMNEFFKCDRDFKESRYLDDAGFKRVCSHDREELSHHSKSCCRNSRRPSELYSPLGKRFDTSNVQSENYQYYEHGAEIKYDKANEHFNFDAESENFGNPSRMEREPCHSFVKSSDRRQKLLNSKNEKISDNGFFPFSNNNESNANFKDFKTKNNGKAEGIISDPKTKNQLVDPEFQASTTTLRKSDSINIFSRDKDPFEGDDFFNSVS